MILFEITFVVILKRIYFRKGKVVFRKGLFLYKVNLTMNENGHSVSEKKFYAQKHFYKTFIFTRKIVYFKVKK